MADIGAHELQEITRGLDDTSKVIFQTQYSSAKKDRGVTTILAVILGCDREKKHRLGRPCDGYKKPRLVDRWDRCKKTMH